MVTTPIRRRQTQHTNVGVLSDADMFQAHARLTVRARGPQRQHDGRTGRHERTSCPN